MSNPFFSDRDISWLSFNERVLSEAAKTDVPLMERIRFLAIFSSNLDEFYRVRMPALLAIEKIKRSKKKPEERASPDDDNFTAIKKTIAVQQKYFGAILTEQLIPALHRHGTHLVYNESIPDQILVYTNDYFFDVLSAFIRVVYLRKSIEFFPENNKLYLAVALEQQGQQDIALINIPSDLVPRFYYLKSGNTDFVVFIDDIIRNNLRYIFPAHQILGAFSVKVTRDAELNLQDEFEGDIAEKIEKQISKRDFGLATRFLYQPDLLPFMLEQLVTIFKLSNASIVPGGNYHNLKDFLSFPVQAVSLQYAFRRPLTHVFRQQQNSLFSEMEFNDLLIHTPYFSYNPVLRFFNEAALDDQVQEIYTTLYRVANDSRIVQALITAALNGKLVTVFVELKARFDEANNIKWAKRMKAAGVKIIYSIPHLKVHAKVALVKRRRLGAYSYLGLLATGNLNENTAKFYTDHVLLTVNGELLRELELLFMFLGERKLSDKTEEIQFSHLLVAQFNLQKKFLHLIEVEIEHAKKGLPSGIIIKMNNLEEKILISKLYEASNAGVKVQLIIRSICCLVPGIPGQSMNISVTRIVDRYLEHGRVFLFANNGDPKIYLGSADWMNRNIYRRIEVCFPLYDEALKNEIKALLALQLQEEAYPGSALPELSSKSVEAKSGHSQNEIYQYFLKQMESRHNK